MKNRNISKRYGLIIFLASIVNVLILSIWFSLKISPLIVKMNELQNEIFTNELQNEYNELDILKSDIKKIEEKYSIIISLEDKNGKVQAKTDIKSEISILSTIIDVGDNTYLLKIYPIKNKGIVALFMELLFFQGTVMVTILGLTYLFTRHTVFSPIKKIINDMRNYKFGKKPVKNEIYSEFDLIQNEFVDLTKQLDREKEEQNRIIASISHDIKTPLTSIIGFSDLMRDPNLTNEEKERYNEKINDKALHIKEIISTFDDYLLDSEQNKMNVSLVQVSELVKWLNDDYKIEQENRNIKFLITTNIEKKYIKIDVLKMKRVFSNLISNSVRYISKNGKITIQILDDKNSTKFIVSDNGCGVKKDIIDRIFDPLFTTDNSRKISGLGLSICKNFIELHGGNIKAYNNNGLTIEFTIPDKIKE